MLSESPCRPTIAVRDKPKAIAFFGDVLGLRLVDANQPGATFECGSGTYLEIYPSAFAGTAQSTVAGFQVSDLETAMRELRASGIVFEDYDSPKTSRASRSLAQTVGRGSRTQTQTSSR